MASKFGFWAALGALAASLGYAIPQVMQVLGWLGPPLDAILIYAPSLLLAPAFVLTLAALHTAAEPSRKVFSLSALSLAIVYATLVSTVYVTQLGTVIPLDLAGRGREVAILRCCEAPAFLRSVDLLGYTLMSAATLLAARAVPGPGLSHGVRIALIANGLLAPALFLQLFWPWLIWVGALWLVTFPAAMLLLALWFRRAGATF